PAPNGFEPNRSMNTPKYDAAIIGGGPAGAAAAITLARRGLSVVVLDRAVFPRDKLCGGLLTLRSRRIFDAAFGSAHWDDLVEGTAHGARFFHGTEPLASVDHRQPLALANRRDFDAALLHFAERAGAESRQGVRVQRVEFTNFTALRLRLSNGGEEITARAVVGADGVSSAAARSLFGRAFRRRDLALAVEMEVPLDWPSPRNQAIRRPAIHFGVASRGYGWRFPKRNGTTVGVGGLWRKNPEMAGQFRQFLREWYGEVPPFPIQGHFLPAGNFRLRPGRGPILLAGDAAGLVDPITGEGIALAMESGAMAGRAAADALAAGKPHTALARYRREYRTIAQSLLAARILTFLARPEWGQALLFEKLKGPSGEWLVHRFMDLMAGEMGYGRFAGILARRKLLKKGK
ncbi:MAG: NAD(P)/FAD-dependent oxidoreductase, partial [Desulfococcaceae bacterium]